MKLIFDKDSNGTQELVDALIAYLEQEKFDFWIQSPKRKAVSELLLSSKEAFDFYYVTGSHRLFLTLAPIIREVQQRHIIPIITYGRYEKLVAGQQVAEGFRDAVCRPLALLSMSKAVERLPVEVLPDGVVQVQLAGSVREKLRAEAEARKTVAKSLEQDAMRDLAALEDLVAALDAAPDEPDLYVPSITLQSKGITF